MQINPKIIKKQFEKSLDKYNKNAVVQKLMAQKLVKNLSAIKTDYENVLELGSGTGLLTEEFAKKLNYKNYFANDLSGKSKKYLEAILPEFTFICGNAQKIKPTGKMNLIVSNAMFQWISNLEKFCGHIFNMLDKDGILAFSTFSPDNYQEIKELCGLSLEYKTLAELKEIFSDNFEILYTEEFKYTMQFSNPLELLAHMKNTGVNSLSIKHRNFKAIKEFCDSYNCAYPDLTLTYSPIIVICKKIA